MKDLISENAVWVKTLNNFLKNDYVTAVITILVFSYACNSSPKLPAYVSDLFNNTFFKALVMFFIAFTANNNPVMAVIVTLVFLFTLTVINKQEAEEGFLETSRCSCNVPCILIGDRSACSIWIGCRNSTWFR